MEFMADTVVADAIRADPAVIDRLVALDPVFRKLRNPLLRKVMARLVTFREAARVAGVSLERILAAANDSPIPAADSGAATEDAAEASEPRPDWMDKFDEASARVIDVRPLLAADRSPLGPVMRAASKVAKGEFLVIDAPFDPVPLRRVLAGKGFDSWAEKRTEDHWRVCFKETGGEAERAAATMRAPGAARADAEGAAVWRAHDAVHIDVRGLEPPRPMRAIIALIENGVSDGTIVVHHEREPVFLYPELAERGWSHRIVTGADTGEVRLLLTKEARP